MQIYANTKDHESGIEHAGSEALNSAYPKARDTTVCRRHFEPIFPKTKHPVGSIDLQFGSQLSDDPNTSESAMSSMIAVSIHFEEDCV
jgi:hypothetical protein